MGLLVFDRVIEAHLSKLRKRDRISQAEENAIRRLIVETRRIPAHRTVIREGEILTESILVIDGWLARAKDLSNGERLITELHVAGDFADLHGFTLKRLDHDLIALTNCTIAIAPHELLRRLTEEFPHLARVYWFTTNVDAAIHRQWSVSLGRRNALARAAHLFCELLVRLEIAGRTRDQEYDFPITQSQLAECLGLTPVHVNRTLQELRRRKLIHLDRKQLTILDLEALKAIAEFDASYLYLERRVE